MLSFLPIFVLASGEIVRGLPSRTECLTFHDVVPERTTASLWFDCSVPELSQQLDWLTRHGAHFISVDDLYRHLTTGSPLPPHPVCITFADNYLGFYRYAYPILRRRKIPTAMFVHTGYVGSPVGRPKMDWDQLREIDHNGVAVESQTVTHPPDLRRLPDDKLRHEMVDSKRTLERQLGHQIRYLAYPNGAFDGRCERAAKSAGYAMAFTERLTPAERSPGIYAVSRYVHTKWKRGWQDANP